MVKLWFLVLLTIGLTGCVYKPTYVTEEVVEEEAEEIPISDVILWFNLTWTNWDSEGETYILHLNNTFVYGCCNNDGRENGTRDVYFGEWSDGFPLPTRLHDQNATMSVEGYTWTIGNFTMQVIPWW